MLWGQKTQNTHNSEDLMGWERVPEAVVAWGLRVSDKNPREQGL